MLKYILSVLLLASTTCKSQDGKPVTDLNGAYLMLSQSLEGKSGDTTLTDRKQLKIYSGHYMMYVRLDPEDSISSFGIGRFSISKGRLTEQIIFSATDSTKNTNAFSGTVNISKRLMGYEQVIPQIMSDRGKVRLTEDYQLLNSGAKSPPDGTWKLIAAYSINKKDTMYRNATKYKTYYGGNFSAGSFDTKSSGEKQTIAEYGTFRVHGKNKLTENITCSSISSRKGQSYVVDLLMEGSDVLITNVISTTGSKEVETYRRMK